jgi:uncharacterized BrkB/YihY/UPF0761 family membrane protein
VLISNLRARSPVCRQRGPDQRPLLLRLLLLLLLVLLLLLLLLLLFVVVVLFILLLRNESLHLHFHNLLHLHFHNLLHLHFHNLLYLHLHDLLHLHLHDGRLHLRLRRGVPLAVASLVLRRAVLSHRPLRRRLVRLLLGEALARVVGLRGHQQRTRQLTIAPLN